MRIMFFGFSLIFVFTVCLHAQPQYYNYGAVGNTSSFPMGVSGGKAVCWLYLPGAFNQPSPCPSGQQITRISLYYTGGGRTYSNFRILMAQDTITNLTQGQFPSEQWDTVYFRASVAYFGGTYWGGANLDHPFPYDPTKSFLLIVEHCAAPGSGMNIRQSNLGGVKRVWSVGGCPFTPNPTSDDYTPSTGINVEPALGTNTQHNNVPVDYYLSQNYPNPFNPTTQISYAIPSAGNVKLVVFDILGREIATLVNEFKTAGYYGVNFDASNLASGIYVYRIEAGDFRDTKKMLLIK